MGAASNMWNQYNRMDNKHDPAGLASLFSTDCVYIEPGGRHEGRDAFRALAEMSHRAFPDLKMKASLVIEDGDTVVAEWAWRATHAGPTQCPTVWSSRRQVRQWKYLG